MVARARERFAGERTKLDRRRRKAEREGALPNLIVIGGLKCGTTSLHHYLALHPEIAMSRPKELNFFVAELNWGLGPEWYASHFDRAAPVRGESSPHYTNLPRFAGVAERMRGLLGDGRVIYMVRDPIDRVRANWVHTYSNRAEDRPLRDAVLDPESSYVPRSRYHHQLSRYLEHYPLDGVLVLEQGDLLGDRRETLRRVFGFLEVDENVWHDAFDVQRLETSARRRRTPLGAFVAERVRLRVWRRLRDHRPFSTAFEHPEIDADLRARLTELLADDVARFRELTGRKFASWSL